MENNILTAILFVFSFALLWSFLRNIFKISYYEKKLEFAGIEDGVKDMPLWKLWCT